MNKRFVEYITIKELYVSFKDGLMPIAGQYKLSSSSTHIEMNSPIRIITKIWDDEELFSKSEIISLNFEFDSKSCKYELTKIQRTYTLSCNFTRNTHLREFLNYLETKRCLEETWAEIIRTSIIDDINLREFYKEDNKKKQTLKALMRSYSLNVIHRYL